MSEQDKHVAPIEVDPLTFDHRDMSFILNGLVVPRPIGWISTLSETGIPNLAPFSYFTVASSDPPHLVYSASTDSRDSLVNARETGEFVANIPDRSLMEMLARSAVAVEADIDEFEFAGLEKAPSAKVRPPRVARAKAHLECKVTEIVPVGRSWLVIGKIVHMHVDPSIFVDGRIRSDLLDPIARLGGSYYTTIGDMIRHPTPRIPTSRNGLPRASD